MDRKKRTVRTILAYSFAVMTLFSFLGIRASATTALGKINISMIGRYDSADTATIREVDTVNRTIRLKNHALGKTYTLSYDNTSMIYDAYGNALSASLLEPGQIVDVTFLKNPKTLTTLSVNKDAWYIDSTRDHDLVRNDGTAVVKGSIYKIDPRTMVLAENKPALAEDILSTDSIAVSGVGKDIYSVVVTGGHGYVSLSSDVVENQSLVGAWLELDNTVIHKISPNMLLSAPEGDYNLQIIGNGANYQSKVNVSRNQETVIDTSNVTIAKPKEGLVTFEITPETADVFVDGNRMLTGVPQNIVYGYHNLKIMADGYETQTKYLKVGTPKSVISIELEEIEADSDEAASSEESTGESTGKGNAVDVSGSNSSSEIKDISSETVDVSKLGSSQTVSGNSSEEASSSASSSSAQNTVISSNKIYFDEPNGAELYFDGNYIGIIPTSITKVSGNHEVIVKKDGYETKSYRIHIDSEETDLKYEFPALVAIKKEESSSSSTNVNITISGNSSSEVADSSNAASSKEEDASSVVSSDASSEVSSDASSEASSETSSEAGSENSESAGDASSEASGASDSSSEASSDDSSGDSASDQASDSGDAGNSSSTNNEEVSDAASTASASVEN